MNSSPIRIDYIEFSALDLNVFKEFYGSVFGWSFEDWGPDYISFSGAGLEGGVNGGETPVEGTTRVILYSDNLEKTAEAIVAAGGEILEALEFPGGRRFHYRDPCGNHLAVWKKVKG